MVDLPSENHLLFANVNLVLTQSKIDSLRNVAQAGRCPLPWTGEPRNVPCQRRRALRAGAQRIHDDRLACSRLPGQHTKTGRQLYFELFYGGELVTLRSLSMAMSETHLPEQCPLSTRVESNRRLANRRLCQLA